MLSKNNSFIKRDNNIKILAISSLIGVLAGTISVLYRIVLTESENLAFNIYNWLSHNIKYLPIALVVLAILGYFIGLITKKYPMISGSGIPQLKGRVMGHIKSNWFTTMIFKFLGGAASVLAGLSLGREGPSIQLGACVAEGVAKNVKTTKSEKRIYIASGASAGLAAAFNAPLAGVIFVIEEIFRYFSPMILLTSMVSAVIADFISSMIFGLEPVLYFEITDLIPLNQYWILIVLGIVIGFSGVMYNYVLLKTQKLYKKIKDVKYRVMIPFIIAPIVGILFPIAICGGHAITYELTLKTGIMTLFLILVVKFIFTMISFGSGAPGGIFFPLLILGAAIGAIFAKISIESFGLPEELFNNFIILAMAGYFTAIVRAPITGIVLLMEMTGSFDQLLPLIITSVIAYIVAEELKCTPIYDALLANLLKSEGKESEVENDEKIIIDAIVHHGAFIEEKHLKEVKLPDKSLIVTIKRGNKEITPNGNTEIKAGDHVYVLTDLTHEIEVRNIISKITTK